MLFNASSAIIAHEVPFEQVAVARLESLANLHGMRNCDAIVYVRTSVGRGVDLEFIEQTLRRLEVRSATLVYYRIPGRATGGYIGIDRDGQVTIAPKERELELPGTRVTRSRRRDIGGPIATCHAKTLSQRTQKHFL